MLFCNQEEANQYFEKIEELADKVDDKETAIELLQMIDVCYENEEDFFIPAIIMAYEEMALSYVDYYKIVK